MVEITDKEIKKVLSYPIKIIVQKLLDEVNLKSVERKIVELIDMQGYRKEEVARKLGLSKRTVYNYRKSAFKKISIALEKNKTVEEILRLD